MTGEQLERGKAVQEELADLKRELGWITDAEAAAVPAPLAIRMKGNLHRVPRDIVDDFRDKAAAYLIKRISDLEKQFSNI